MREDKEGMKLNLGCGNKTKPGYINVDIQSHGDVQNTNVMGLKVDIQSHGDVQNTNVMDLKYEPDSIEEVYMPHLLEHLYYDDAMKLLDRIRSWLIPGGRLLIAVPDLTVICRLISQGESKSILFFWLYGNSQKLEGMNHHWGYTRKTLGKELEERGFKITEKFTDKGDDSAYVYYIYGDGDDNYCNKEVPLSLNLVAVKEK